MVRRRAAGWFDPSAAQAFERRADDIFAELEAGSVWDAVLGVEPAPPATIPEWRVDDVAAALADAVDVKSPYLLGHSSGVARLAEGAARRLGLGDEESAVPLGFQGFAYVLDGEAAFGANRRPARPAQLVLLGPGEEVAVTDAAPGTRTRSPSSSTPATEDEEVSPAMTPTAATATAPPVLPALPLEAWAPTTTLHCGPSSSARSSSPPPRPPTTAGTRPWTRTCAA